MQIVMVTGGPVATNSYLVADDAGQCFVLDPGFDPSQPAAEVAARGWHVAAIVATHGHFDHVGGIRQAKELWDAPLWMHPLAIPIATTASQHALWFGITSEDSPPPDQTFEHGDTFTVGDLSFEVRHTPGHSPGGVSLVCDGHAFVGDTLFQGSVGRYDLPHSDYDALMRSIREELMTLPDETLVFPGHGEVTRIGVERRTNPLREEFGVLA
jgi:glyoxylase-like metal-dependent hydrolase (beta-lactamase superfamily II)